VEDRIVAAVSEQVIVSGTHDRPSEPPEDQYSPVTATVTCGRSISSRLALFR
jgi:hypothetical protein